MKLLQISFAMLLSCMIGFSSPYALALVIVGALIPNIDGSDRYYGNIMEVKGPTHSLLFVVLTFFAGIFWHPLFYVGIGVLGHVVIELFSAESQMMILYPLKTKVHIPLFKQYTVILRLIGLAVIVILFVFFINIDTLIDICYVSYTWVMGVVHWFANLVEHAIYRLSALA